MPEKTARLAIVGGGLSGLYAAYVLEQQGVQGCVLLEARDSLGGRIVSAPAAGQPAPRPATNKNPGTDSGGGAGAGMGTVTTDRVDLGPTWFWPEGQHQLARLVHDLGLQSFAQFDAGDTVVEPALPGLPARVRGCAQAPASVRLVGGMAALVEALHSRLQSTRIHTGQAVRRLRVAPDCVEIDSEGQGADRGAATNTTTTTTTWRAEHVLLALPPRLVEHGIAFSPALPPALALQWHATATWMAPHAKYLAVYAAPFWRAQGLSGTARSARGPLVEIHDACMPGGSAALFGFVGVPAQVRHSVSAEEVRAHCRAQLVRLFGSAAATPTAEHLQDWALDPFTATAADGHAGGGHLAAQVPAPGAAAGPWHGRFTGIASEWSPQFPGYLAGAIEAASLGVEAVRARRG